MFFKLRPALIALTIAFSPLLTASSNPLEAVFLLDIVSKLEQGENIIFTKYGDGEYNCMVGINGHNCDHDNYHPWLGNALKKALISLSKKPNTYIGRWWPWNPKPHELCDKIAQENSVVVPWAHYHLFMNDDEFLKFDYMRKFVEFVVKTKRKKILVCNSMNSRLREFFKVNEYIQIPAQNWSYEYEKYKVLLEKALEENAIILIAGGMCSKVLIDDITNTHNVTCIDLGCSFDILGSKNNTRGWQHSYHDELRYYKDFIPKNW